MEGLLRLIFSHIPVLLIVVSSSYLLMIIFLVYYYVCEMYDFVDDDCFVIVRGEIFFFHRTTNDASVCKKPTANNTMRINGL